MFFDLGRQPWGNHFVRFEQYRPGCVPFYPLELFFCHDCSLVQLGYTVPKETMFVDHNYISGTTRSLRTHFTQVANSIMERVPFGPGDYVVDIGGNDGTFLTHFLPHGIQVLNVDSGRTQAALSEKAGVPAINAFFEAELADRVRRERGPAKIIHGSGVLFHLEELHSVFDGIRRLLASDGMLVAEFIYLPDMVRNCAFDQVYHEHLLYYSLTSFGKLLAKHGLEIFDCQMSPIHGGSCVAFVGHRGEQAKTARFEAALEDEIKDGFDRIDVYKVFSERARTLAKDLAALTRQFVKDGKRVYALGAPVKGTTILHFSGLGDNEISCAVEINTYKCGTYLPGTRIPVLHQDTVLPPDVYLMLSWNFKDEILGKLGPFLEQGGKIIVPVPELEVIEGPR